MTDGSTQSENSGASTCLTAVRVDYLRVILRRTMEAFWVNDFNIKYGVRSLRVIEQAVWMLF